MPSKHSAVKVEMGIDKMMLVRLQRPLQADLKKLYEQIFDGIPGPPMTRFIGFCLAEGIEAVKQRHARPPRRKR